MHFQKLSLNAAAITWLFYFYQSRQWTVAVGVVYQSAKNPSAGGMSSCFCTHAAALSFTGAFLFSAACGNSVRSDNGNINSSRVGGQRGWNLAQARC